MRQVALRERDIAKLAEALHALTRNRWGTITLTANAASTSVINTAVNENTGVLLIGLTPNAKIEEHTSPYCLVTASRGSFLIAHNNNTQIDREFFWIGLGE